MELMDPSVPRLRHDTSFSRAGSMPNQGDFESSSLGVSGHFTPSQYSKIKNKNKKTSVFSFQCSVQCSVYSLQQFCRLEICNSLKPCGKGHFSARAEWTSGHLPDSAFCFSFSSASCLALRSCRRQSSSVNCCTSSSKMKSS